MEDVTIQIPLFNEIEALNFSNFYFKNIGVDVQYALDSQCSEKTRTLANELGVQYSEFENGKPFIENGYENFAAASPTDWILRIDCDEIATPELIDVARSFAASAHGVCSFERLQVLWEGDRFVRPSAERFDPKAQRQYRLFDRRRVQFDTTIHSAGIRVDAPTHAPSQACLYHMSWIFLSWEERLAKAARYDAHGQPAANRENQLFSLQGQDWTDVPSTVVDTIYKRWLFGR